MAFGSRPPEDSRNPHEEACQISRPATVTCRCAGFRGSSNSCCLAVVRPHEPGSSDCRCAVIESRGLKMPFRQREPGTAREPSLTPAQLDRTQAVYSTTLGCQDRAGVLCPIELEYSKRRSTGLIVGGPRGEPSPLPRRQDAGRSGRGRCRSKLAPRPARSGMSPARRAPRSPLHAPSDR